MPIKQTTPKREANNLIEAIPSRLLRVVIRNLSYCGELCVNEARLHHTYTDRTGGLTSSMGYVIVRDGQIIRYSDFTPTKNTPEAKQGAKDGKAFAEELAAKYSKGIVLIVVAGRKYAAYVSARGYTTIESAERLGKRVAPRMLKQLL